MLLWQIFKVRLSVEAPHEYGPPPHVYVALNQTSLLETVLILPAALPTTSEVFLFANIEFLMIPLLGTNCLVLSARSDSLSFPNLRS
jgi:hypothetical protein